MSRDFYSCLGLSDCSTSSLDTSFANCSDISVPTLEEISSVLRRLPSDIPSHVVVSELFGAGESIPSLEEISSVLRRLPSDVPPHVIVNELYNAGRKSTKKIVTPEVTGFSAGYSLPKRTLPPTISSIPLDGRVNQDISNLPVASTQLQFSLRLDIPSSLLVSSIQPTVSYSSDGVGQGSHVATQPLAYSRNIFWTSNPQQDPGLENVGASQLRIGKKEESLQVDKELNHDLKTSPVKSKNDLPESSGSLKKKQGDHASVNCPLKVIWDPVIFRDCAVGDQVVSSLELHNTTCFPATVKLISVPEGFNIGRVRRAEGVVMPGDVENFRFHFEPIEATIYIGQCHLEVNGGGSRLSFTLVGRGRLPGELENLASAKTDRS